MDAPIYPPAAVYKQPVTVPGQFNLNSLTIGELLASPASRAILMADPNLAKQLIDPPWKQHMYNLTMRASAGLLKGVTPELLDQIDVQLNALPESERPVI
jgi:hypothetical protein